MQRAALKERACKAIDARREQIIALGEDTRTHPELGFKEVRTAALVAAQFRQLGIPCQEQLAVTGVKGLLTGAAERVTVAYVSELDSVLVPDHPLADPQTGAAHACGHNAQIANLAVVAIGLKEGDVMPHLGGNVALIAAPAEEYVELAYRMGLSEAGKIEFLSGKQELLRVGAFDDVSLVLATHQGGPREGKTVSPGGPSNGCIAKVVRFIGKAAHAGGAPHDGVNALQAAHVAMAGINALRETFRDSDHIRVHPIITKGGDLVNIVPADVHMEMYVRGASVNAMLKASRAVDRCLQAGALAASAAIEITSLAGYMPKVITPALDALYMQNAGDLLGADALLGSEFGAGSTDIGDISMVMPAIEAVVGGCSGTGHGADFAIADDELAYIVPAKLAVMTLIDLLADDAAGAQTLLADYQAPMTRTQYLETVRSLNQTSTYDYREAPAI
ncbi:MAG: amidohydrolase [Chloroflexi bacterium]|nr:amidohydrolase [Chloroflexota bacterium]